MLPHADHSRNSEQALVFSHSETSRSHARGQAAEAPSSPVGDLYMFCVEQEQPDTSGDTLP